jgi:hypothetical protein
VRRVAVAAGSLAVVAALAVSARATHSDLVDPNDVRGVLDVHTVVFRHESGPYAWVFGTFPSWTVRGIWDRGFFVVELDTLGSKAVDYRVVLRSNGRSMIGDLFRLKRAGDLVHLRTLPSWRAGSHGGGVELPRAAVRYGSGRTSFFWRTASLFTGERCRTSCLDLVPDGGTMVEQLLVEPTPSPTITPTTSASPTPSPTTSPTP